MNRKHNPIIAILVGYLFVASFAGANSLAVTAGAAMGPLSSAWGLEVILDDPAGTAFTPAWVMADETKGFNDETSLNGSFFIGPQNVTMSQSLGQNHFQTFVMLQAFGTALENVPIIFFLHRDNTSGNWFLTAWHYNENVNNYVFSGTGFLALWNSAFFAENLVEFEWTAGNPGSLIVYRTVWTGGAPDPSGRVQLMNVSLPGQANVAINKVIAGIFAGHKVGTFGSLFLDEFVFTR
jgi:hypothetical protein